MIGRQAHRTATFVLCLLMAALGVGIIVEAFAGYGSIPVRLLLGALFIAAGGGRSYLEIRRSRG